MTVKKLAIQVVMLGVAAMPMWATPITWYFEGSAANGGVELSDGAVLSGSFTFDADVFDPTCNGANYGNACATPNMNGDYGLFGSASNISVTSTGGFPIGATWYFNTNTYDVNVSNDCCSDSSDIYLVTADPANGTANLGPGGLDGAMSDAGGTISIFDASGPCGDAPCGQVIPGLDITDADAVISTIAPVPPTPQSTPEPGTYLLAGTALVLVGSLRARMRREQ
jgi:hypothetical protein